MSLPIPQGHDPVFKAVRAIAAVGARWHRATCDAIERIPEGGVLLVGNHGLYGLEVPVFFYLIHAATGRCPIGLADRSVFSWRPVRALLARCGGLPGTFDNGLELLQRGELVVCYPGGSREVFKAPSERYRLHWDRSNGFARLAIAAGVPIVPFAALGVDDSYRNLGYLPGMRALLGRYAVPIAVGLGPLPWPTRFQFRIGQPIAPPSQMSGALALKQEVAASVRALLDDAASESEPQEERDGAALAPATATVY